MSALAQELNVIWTPNPKQAVFMSRPEKEALYGGAAGGGKSDALLMEALRQVHISHYAAIIFRRTFPQLRELEKRSREIYPRVFPGARYNSSLHMWKFPSGATILLRQMPREQDKHNYQGHAYDFIGFDELTHFTFEMYQYLVSRNRPSGPGTRVYMRSTANPGGVGHGWVKDYFITVAPPMTTTWHKTKVTMPDGAVKKMWRDRIFVPASIFDNPKLLENDPEYLANLASLPEAERMALLYGDWNSFDGQVFREFTDDPAHYDDRKHTHVINPFDVPESWQVVRGLDWGFAKPFSVGWYALSPEKRMYRIVELYGTTGTPNVGVKMNVPDVAAQVWRMEREHPLLAGREISGIADPSIFAENGGQSIAAQMGEYPYHVYWQPGDNTRIAGKMQFHNRLAFDDRGFPMFQVFNTCVHFIRTIPSLVYDDMHVEDVDTEGEDHIYDECRYVMMRFQIKAPPKKQPPPPKEYNPLDTGYDITAPRKQKYSRIYR